MNETEVTSDIYDLVELLPALRKTRHWEEAPIDRLTVTFNKESIEHLHQAIVFWERYQRGMHTMNSRQAAKAAAKKIEEQEALIAEQDRLLNLYKADVKNFYECIEGTVDGKSICDWCDAYNECQLQDKGGRGCKEWEHILQQPQDQGERSEADDSERILSASPES